MNDISIWVREKLFTIRGQPTADKTFFDKGSFFKNVSMYFCYVSKPTAFKGERKEEVRHKMAGNGCTSRSWIKLNVGGITFLTTKTSLTKEPESFLARLATEDPDLPSDKDENNAYLIDRDPKYFSPILNYLRHGKIIIDQDLSVEGVLAEAEFYNLKSLVQQLQERLKVNTVAGMKHVYRVLQCQEEELAHTISNMSDGWRFEQLLNIGSNYNYGPDEQGEYLCIVSKDITDSQNASAEEMFPTNFNPKVFQLRGT